MIFNRINIPVVKYGPEGNPIKPSQYLDGAWERYMKRVKKYADGFGWSYQEMIESEMITPPPVRIRIGRNRWSHYVGENDYRKVLERMLSKNLIPKTSEIAKELGMSVSTLKRKAKKDWHLILPHSQPQRKYSSWRLKGKFAKRGTI